jgi:osmoprotectant transport system ATP-binding protein
MIEFQHISKTYDNGKTYAVYDLSLTVAAAEILVFLGTSGCGKTTTLKMINRLIEPTSGVLKVDGIRNSELDPVMLRRNMGYVFQGVGLFPHMSVEDNITIVLRLEGKSLAARKERAHELLHLVNLPPEQFANRSVTELSGGQQQRVGVARALANDPKFLLMDEPFGALDSITRYALQEELLKLNQTLKKTIVFVTHDLFEAFRLADRIMVMDQGGIKQIGSKEELINSPANEFVKSLMSMHRTQQLFMMSANQESE